MQPSMQDFSLVVQSMRRMNGYLSAGIPTRIVTDKVLEDFLLVPMILITTHRIRLIQLLFGIKVVLKSTNHLNMMPFSICLMK
jgi:hypothetical protein